MKTPTPRWLSTPLLLLTLLAVAPLAHAYYDPEIQRWINRDPLGDDGSLAYAVTRTQPHLESGSLRELEEVAAAILDPLGTFTELNVNLCGAVGNNPVANVDFLGLDFSSCYADCIERHRSPLSRSIGEIANAACNKLVGPVPGRFPSRQGPGHPTTWQHKLGSRLGSVGSKIGKYLGWFGIIVTVADGFYDWGLVTVGCAAACSDEIEGPAPTYPIPL